MRGVPAIAARAPSSQCGRVCFCCLLVTVACHGIPVTKFLLELVIAITVQVLRSNALRLPHDTNVICALAAAEAAGGRGQDALALARHALLLAPKSTTALLCMSRVQASCGAPALAVLAMHLVVPPSDRQVLFKRIFPCGLPPFARITTPSCMPWSADNEIQAVLEEEACMPCTAHAVADWQPFVQQLCGIQDGGSCEGVHTNHDQLDIIICNQGDFCMMYVSACICIVCCDLV